MKLDPYSTPYTKINSTWRKDAILKSETVKLLEGIIGEPPWHLFEGIISLMEPEGMGKEVILDKWDGIKRNSFSTTKKQ
jgi:hypothetical protein